MQTENNVGTIWKSWTKSRGIEWYEYSLRFMPDAIKGKSILNVGSGRSDLGWSLRNHARSVVDADLDPTSYGSNRIRIIQPIIKAVEKVDSALSGVKRVKGNLDKLKNKVQQAGERKFVVANTQHLPFADRQFDTVLALYSTYFFDDPIERGRAFNELLRVGNTVHLGPVWGRDYETINKLAEQMEYEVVVSHPFPSRVGMATGDTASEPFMVKSEE